MTKRETPQIIQELFHGGHLGHQVVEASAGTGKTFTIVQMVLELILRGVPLEQILLVTFTEKASFELTQRVEETIRKALQETQEGALLLDEKERALLQRAFWELDKAQVFTIHGFSHKIAAEFSFLTGQPLSQPQVESRSLVADHLHRFLEEKGSKDPHLKLLLTWFLDNFSLSKLKKLLTEGITHSWEQINVDTKDILSWMSEWHPFPHDLSDQVLEHYSQKKVSTNRIPVKKLVEVVDHLVRLHGKAPEHPLEATLSLHQLQLDNPRQVEFLRLQGSVFPPLNLYLMFSIVFRLPWSLCSILPKRSFHPSRNSSIRQSAEKESSNSMT